MSPACFSFDSDSQHLHFHLLFVYITPKLFKIYYSEILFLLKCMATICSPNLLTTSTDALRNFICESVGSVTKSTRCPSVINFQRPALSMDPMLSQYRTSGIFALKVIADNPELET